MGRVTRLSFTEDEVVNMVVRRRAGEPVESIAEDYDCSTQTIYGRTREEIRREPGLARTNSGYKFAWVERYGSRWRVRRGRGSRRITFQVCATREEAEARLSEIRAGLLG